MFHQSGAPKKKGLTDPVEIIPFPNQDLRKIANKRPKQTKPAAAVTLKVEEPKILKAPTGTLSTSNLSIKKIKELNKKKSDTSTTSTRGDLNNDYSFDDLKMYWRQYAFIAKEEKKDTIFNSMIKRDLKIKENHNYELLVDNHIQVSYFHNEMGDLLGFIRGKLKNSYIDIKVTETETEEEEVKHLTGKDRFKALARKNLNLHSLKKMFNLDIDY